MSLLQTVTKRQNRTIKPKELSLMAHQTPASHTAHRATRYCNTQLHGDAGSRILSQDWVAGHFSRKHKRGLNKKSVYCSITGLTEVLALVISINDKNEASIMHCNWWSLF